MYSIDRPQQSNVHAAALEPTDSSCIPSPLQPNPRPRWRLVGLCVLVQGSHPTPPELSQAERGPEITMDSEDSSSMFLISVCMSEGNNNWRRLNYQHLADSAVDCPPNHRCCCAESCQLLRFKSHSGMGRTAWLWQSHPSLSSGAAGFTKSLTSIKDQLGELPLVGRIFRVTRNSHVPEDLHLAAFEMQRGRQGTRTTLLTQPESHVRRS